MPVSYTHLDVYKRQVQDGAGFLLSNMKGNAAMNAGSDLHDVVLMSATGSISGLEDGQSLAARDVYKRQTG